MKELSIEKKAKAYDEALERAKSAIKECGNNQGRIAMIESIFPELKESEDERIRKALIRFHKSTIDIDGIKGDEIVAWLEKQDEQKPTQEIEPTPIFRIGDILKRKGKDYTFRVDRIQGGYYHCDRNNGAFFPIEEQGNWELVEQKPAWSEEDEKMIDAIYSCVDSHYDGLAKTSLLIWLKSLKDRYTWKPNKEQMKALHDLNLTGNISYAGQGQTLIELYNDLKKLKGE